MMTAEWIRAPKPKRRKPVRWSTHTKAHLEKQYGWVCAFVERCVYPEVDGKVIPRRFDAFGLFDHIAIRPIGQGVVGVQTCSRSTRAEHLRKIHENPVTKLWLERGNTIALVSWTRGSPGKRHKCHCEWVGET